jgi:hypothetical protein
MTDEELANAERFAYNYIDEPLLILDMPVSLFKSEIDTGMEWIIKLLAEVRRLRKLMHDAECPDCGITVFPES